MAGNEIRIHSGLDGVTQVVGGLRAIKGEANSLGTGIGSFATSAEKGFGKFETAIGHAKTKIAGLASGLGLLAGGAGLLGLGTALTSSVNKASDLGVAVANLTKVTHDSTETVSGLLAVFERFGIDSGTASKALGMLEKNAFNYSTTAKKAAAFTKEFGFSLTDAKGKVKDADTLLLQASDYYVKNKNAAQAAALEAKLFGRSWQALVPVLSLGSAKIKDAEQAAADLGLTLNAQNAKDLAKYKESMRGLGEAWGALQLQIGLAVIPALTDLSTTLRKFVTDNKAGIVAAFKDGVKFAQDLGAVIEHQVIPAIEGIAGGIATMWSKVPGPLQDLIVKGFLADKAFKFIFGVDVVGDIAGAVGKAVVGSLGKGVASSLVSAGIGKAFVQPVFVTNPGFSAGGLPGAAATGAEDAGVVAGGAEVAGGLTAGALVAPAAGIAIAVLGSAAVVKWINDTAAEEQSRGVHSTAPVSLSGGARLGGAVMASDNTAAAQNYSNWAKQVTGDLDHMDVAAKLWVNDLALIRKMEHDKAREAVGGDKAGMHAFLAALRDGSAKVAIDKWPAEFRYLKTASDAQQHTSTFTRGVQEDIKALQKAEVHATADQKTKLAAEIRALQGLLRSINSSVKASASEIANTVAYNLGAATGKGGHVKNARGLLGLTAGQTDLGDLGVAGEANGEAVAIVANPHPLRSGGMGGSLQIDVHVHAGSGIITPGMSQAIGQGIGPVLLKWMQRNGVLPLRGTPQSG